MCQNLTRPANLAHLTTRIEPAIYGLKIDHSWGLPDLEFDGLGSHQPTVLDKRIANKYSVISSLFRVWSLTDIFLACAGDSFFWHVLMLVGFISYVHIEFDSGGATSFIHFLLVSCVSTYCKHNKKTRLFTFCVNICFMQRFWKKKKCFDIKNWKLQKVLT